MRLGGTGSWGGGPPNSGGPRWYRTETADGLEGLIEELDQLGLATIGAPGRTLQMSERECVEFGDKAEELGLVIAEVVFPRNLHVTDSDLRRQYIDEAQTLLRNADRMRSRCVFGLAGSADPSGDFRMPHPYNFTDEFKDDLAGYIREILDGVQIMSTKFVLEPGNKTFFHKPEGCAALVEAVDHPDFGIHLNIMNMVSEDTYFSTTELVNKAFELLGDQVVAAHMKDIKWDKDYNFLKFDEVAVGEGVLDYRTFLQHLTRYDRDFPALCLHLMTKTEYEFGFERLHEIADELGAPFVRRGPLIQAVR
jgi:sugar phosphate isomerase/epimerase